MKQLKTQPELDADTEYRAIEATLLEAARGRWFLAEHSRRARRLDSVLLEDAIGKLQNSIRQPPALLGQLQAEVEGIRAKIEETKAQLVARPSASFQAGAATAATSSETAQPSGPAAATGDWQPMAKMLQAAEDIHEQAWALQSQDLDPAACEAIARQASSLYALSMHQAAHSNRILKLADALDATSARIEGILQSIALELQPDMEAGASDAAISAPDAIEKPDGNAAAADSAA